MSDDGEALYPAGVDVPGTPAPFPFGLVSFGLSIAAVVFGLAGMIVGSASWLPVFEGQPLLYWLALAGCIVCAGLSVRQRRWGWAMAGTTIGVVSLTPIFPLLLVLLLSVD